MIYNKLGVIITLFLLLSSFVYAEDTNVLNYNMNELGDYVYDSSNYVNDGQAFNVHLINDSSRIGYWFSEGDSSIVVPNSLSLTFDENGVYVWEF